MPLKIEPSTVMLQYWQSQPSQGDWIVLHSMTRCTSLLYDTSGFDQGAMCTVHCALCTVHCPVKQVGLGRPSTAILSCCSPPIPPQGDANNTHNCANKSRQSHLELPPKACIALLMWFAFLHLSDHLHKLHQVSIYLFKAPLFCNMCKTFPFQCFQRNTSTNHHFCLLSVCVWEALDLLELHNTLSNCQKPSWNCWLSDGGSFFLPHS